MFRTATSSRILVGLALTAAVGTGVGLAAAGVGPFSAMAAPPALHALTAAASTAAAPATDAAPSAVPPTTAPLTADQAKAVALQASPGTVVDVQQENGAAEAGDPAEASDPTKASDPTEASDPSEAPDATEPTGLSYDVTILHQDGTTTEVVVDAASGHVVSTKVDDSGTGN